ncbi:MAG: lamin tail domain-containing protein, partial [Candidatus Zixiibacteriota bacterium]
TSLEWFELYNSGASRVNLWSYLIDIAGQGLVLDDSLDPGQYAVVCKDSAGFAAYWAIDSDSIDFKIIEASFGILTNDSGRIVVLLTGNPESELIWPGAGADGVSWERMTAVSSDAVPSTDPSGSTPGRLNTRTLLPNDLSLDTVVVEAAEGGAALTFLTRNVGLQSVDSAVITVAAADTGGPVVVYFEQTLPPLDTGYTNLTSRTVPLPGFYVHLQAYLSDDDRLDNNSIVFMAPGSDYPPVVLSEFLANPTDGLTSEWIELFNRCDSAIEVSGWQIGDMHDTNAVSDSDMTLLPGQYLVLAADTMAFRQYYGAFSGSLVQPPGWTRLNNGRDTLLLIDPYGIEADRFEYIPVYDSNFTWARGRLYGDAPAWGRSVDPGGTPGEENEVELIPQANTLEVDISPRIFSPDGNGFEDSTIFTIIAPRADSYTFKIFDRQGRVVKTFLDEQPYLAADGVYTWDGRSDGGGRLPIGIYVVYFDASGVQSLKETVVIAR